MPAVRMLAVLGLLVPVAVGCGGDGGGSNGATLHVFAAASLTDAFEELGRTFEADHPGIDVRFNFGSSSALAEQIIQGADADVFASADDRSMAKLVDAGGAGDSKVFARNRLSIIVAPGNPKRIHTLADLVADDLVVALCAPEVPCGRYAAEALEEARIEIDPATLEENVRAVVAKVTLGEVDAGIVYATDVLAGGERADGVAIRMSDGSPIDAVYPIAVTTRTSDRRAAAAWIDHVLSDTGQRVLTEFGFATP